MSPATIAWVAVCTRTVSSRIKGPRRSRHAVGNVR